MQTGTTTFDPVLIVLVLGVLAFIASVFSGADIISF
jgi:hypothetical protein